MRTAGPMRRWWRTWLAPGMLGGITAGRWAQLVWRHGTAIPPRYWPKAMTVTVTSAVNSVLGGVETLCYARRWRRATPVPPVVVLGHWRSGTTLLHEYLRRDPDLSAPTVYEASFPSTFLLTGRWGPRLLQGVLPGTRLVDGMRFGYDAAAEDEYALLGLALASSYLGAVFPAARAHYARWISGGADAGESERWVAAMRTWVAKLSLRHGRVVLKAPAHTARLGLLARAFPGARFVHVHRHPYDVVRSTVAMERVMQGWLRMQPGDEQRDPFPQWILDRYRDVHARYLADRAALPREAWVEVGYDALVESPLATLRTIYEELGLAGFDAAKPHFAQHAAAVARHQRRPAEELTPAQRRAVRAIAQPCFAEWGYTP